MTIAAVDTGAWIIIGLIVTWAVSAGTVLLRIGRMTQRLEELAENVRVLREWKHAQGNERQQIGMIIATLEADKKSLDDLRSRVMELERRPRRS